ncbi:hypothetical protein L2E82_02418 [Cichorium intybus]|uniref:Uncharacterized protein n=1 Tax=Cichorium intybus TaxID=13427 RepID=A0ACB9H2Q9_CICIN|nr:hypothetical protein L1887_03830 [Cichorium endivia]KAI3789618.1 hypothetical protein L2E82_02418 [Cichorium intybus]
MREKRKGELVRVCFIRTPVVPIIDYSPKLLRKTPNHILTTHLLSTLCVSLLQRESRVRLLSRIQYFFLYYRVKKRVGYLGNQGRFVLVLNLFKS